MEDKTGVHTHSFVGDKNSALEMCEECSSWILKETVLKESNVLQKVSQIFFEAYLDQESVCKQVVL